MVDRRSPSAASLSPVPEGGAPRLRLHLLPAAPRAPAGGTGGRGRPSRPRPPQGFTRAGEVLSARAGAALSPEPLPVARAGQPIRPYQTLLDQIFWSLTTSPVFGACQILLWPA